MLRIYRSLPDALKDGWTVYDRWNQGVVLTQRIEGKTEVALIDFLGAPLPKYDPASVDAIVTGGVDPEC
jgi:hypothetical protein